METLKFLLIAWSKRSSKASQKVRGFTLIELLVAMIMAALIITPLLGLVVNLMNTDRQEQAKTTSEQELQTAMEYISRDLQQAVYIYDAGALTNTSSASRERHGFVPTPPRAIRALRITSPSISSTTAADTSAKA